MTGMRHCITGQKIMMRMLKDLQPELLLLDEKDELLSETKNLTKGQMEAHMIATRIADMKQHMQVTDKESGQLRPLRYSDIVILLRSLKDYGTDFVQVQQYVTERSSNIT